MDKSVMMLVGKWKCLEGGMWRFRMSERYFAKCVDVEDEDKFDAVEDKIANVYGIDKKKTKMELSFWYEGGDAVFTQQKMPPVSVDSESSLTKFKKIRLEKGGMNMYVSVDEDEDDLPERGGQSELSAYDENVLRAVAIAETGHRGSFQAMGGQDLGSHCLPYTYEEVDFLAEVDEIEQAGMRLALDPSVLRETSLALLESHPQNISIGSPIHLFVLRCVKARNPVACYLESIRLAAVEGLIKEAMDMLGDIPDPSPKILFTKGLYLVSVNRPMDAINAMNQFKHEVVSSRNADRVATLVMTDIKKIAPDQLRFTWTGYTCYLIHPPRRYSECSKCNFWNPCPLCVNWWVL
ncbi:hypothetical protein ISN44_As12g030070 [Arabidopsis suecica]|uniref:Uncharacterized protein n=1 Tax=Arabidopsis suecica TaxID=45249 RepID=A0A8T1YNR5_ARASU|nr:hypothetical protein ISN44_As12g030070 [Arabidopsis suecica]